MSTESGENLSEMVSRYSSYNSTPEEALELFEKARAQCPVPHSDELGGYHLLLNYDDVKRVHADWQAFASSPTVVLPVAPRPGFPPLEFDPPEHTAWRDLVVRAFNADTPGSVEEAVRQDVSNLIAKFESDGSCDLVRDFAEEIPLLALCHIIGFDEDKRSEVRRLTLQTLTDFEEPEKAAAAFMEFSRFGVEAVMQRREDPRDDFLTELSIAEIDGRRLTEIEIGQLMNSFLVAGHGTTVAALSSLLYEVLLRKPVRQQLIENPELVPAAVEETLRLHTPFFGLYRRATRPTEVAGVKIPEDGYLLACWAAANRDPAVYDDPISFKLDRKFTRRNRHLTFGFGLHTCPGAPVARMEMRVAAEELLRRLPDIELTDPDSIKFEFGGTETAAIPALLARFDPRK